MPRETPRADGPNPPDPGKQLLRRRAEAAFHTQESAAGAHGAPPSLQAIQTALHDLGVHQIELEMQNEELRRTQHELEASRAQYFDLYDLAPVGYCTLSPSGLIEQANLTLATLLDVARAALIEQRISTFIFREDQDVFYLLRQRLLATERRQTVDLRLARSDGSPLWANLAATLTPAGDGPRNIRLVLSDIAAQRLADEHLRVSHVALKAVSEGVLITGPDARIIFVNHAFTAMNGYAEEDFIGRNCNLLQGPLTDPATVAAIRRALDERTEFRGEILNYRKDGSTFWSELTISPVIDAQGQLTHFVGISRDVTARKMAEQQLVLAREMAESASRAKSAFLANMSHELRTPLNAIIGMSEILSLDPDGPDAGECIETIHENGDALLALISSILDLSKIEAGRLVLENIPLNLADCLRSAVQSLSAAAEKKQLRLDFSIDPGLPATLTGDPNRLRQILLNLLSNAVKFTDHGEIHLSATRGETAPGEPERLRISVQDTGIGIEAEEIPKLFHNFSQVDASQTRRFGGSGLGLAVDRRLVELMGGRIWVDSVPGEGSTFSFEIPLRPCAEPPPERPPSTPTADATLAKRCPLRILVAEDNHVNQRLISLELRRLGYAPDFADNGAEVLEHLEHEPCDLILMDVQMPVMDGLAAAEEVCRRHPAPGRPEMVAVTAHAFADDRARCLAAGMQDYLSKPLRLTKLAGAIEAAYERHRNP